MPIFGLGDRKYRVEQNWAKLSDDKKLNNISALSIDEEDNIYILQRDNPFIYIFNNEGNVKDTWHNESIVDGHYLKVTSDERILVVDRDHHRIVIFNKSGEIIKIIGDDKNPGAKGIPFNHPTDVAVTDSGDLFVSDGYGNHCVHHFNSNGELLKSWGSPGRNSGEFSIPHSILIDKKDRVLVADRENNRVQFFNQNGDYLEEINKLYKPMDIFEDSQGFIYITDQTPALNMFNSNGKLMGRFRTFGTYGHGVTVNQNGDIYIAEQFHDRITKFVLLS